MKKNLLLIAIVIFVSSCGSGSENDLDGDIKRVCDCYHTQTMNDKNPAIECGDDFTKTLEKYSGEEAEKFRKAINQCNLDAIDEFNKKNN